MLWLFVGILVYYCGILSYSPVIGVLDLVIYYAHWALGVMLHSVKCGTAVTLINGVFLA